MKRLMVIAGFTLLLVQHPAFCMGGPAPEEESTEVQAYDSARVEALDKARAELKSERAEIEKIERYIWSLDVKMNEARRSQNTKRLLQLKELEQDAIERARLIEGSIARKYKDYPELKVSEALEAEKLSAPQQQEIKAESPQAPAAQAAPVPQAPAVQAAAPVKKQANIVYHEVMMGDTLYSISRKYYGTPSLYKEIARLNNITDVSGLQQGMILKIDLRLKNVVPQSPAPTPNL